MPGRQTQHLNLCSKLGKRRTNALATQPTPALTQVHTREEPSGEDSWPGLP